MLNDAMKPEHRAHFIYRGLPPRFGAPELAKAVENGMIAKADLVDGERYVGWCRNADVARWDAKANKFVYLRTKFGSTFEETIVHPEDDDGYDIFVPVERAEVDGLLDQATPVDQKTVDTIRQLVEGVDIDLQARLNPHDE